MNNSKNHNLVLFTLALSERPLSISDVQFRSGLSYNTVKRTLLGDDRVVRHGGYPALFSMDMPSQFDTKRITVQYDRPTEGWMAWLEEIRPLLVSITAITEDMSLDEAGRKETMFYSLGRSFVSLSGDLNKAIENNDNMPWFDSFGAEYDGAS